MDISTARDFFMWCTIINIGLLLLSSVMTICCSDLVYRIHTRWIKMSRETFNVVIYSYLGIYKILILMLNLVPYIALEIMS